MPISPQHRGRSGASAEFLSRWLDQFSSIGLVVMIFAGIVLFGGSYFSMRALLKADAE